MKRFEARLEAVARRIPPSAAEIVDQEQEQLTIAISVLEAVMSEEWQSFDTLKQPVLRYPHVADFWPEFLRVFRYAEDARCFDVRAFQGTGRQTEYRVAALGSGRGKCWLLSYVPQEERSGLHWSDRRNWEEDPDIAATNRVVLGFSASTLWRVAASWRQIWEAETIPGTATDD